MISTDTTRPFSTTLTLDTAFNIYIRDRGRHLAVPERITAAQRHLYMNLPGGRSITCDRINPAMIRDYIAKRKTKGRASSTIRRELVTLKAVLRHCWKEELLDRVPFIPLPPESPPLDRVLTDHELKRLLVEVKKTRHVWLFTMIAIHTAARKSAITGLTWDRVDLQNNLIDLNNPALKGKPKPAAIMPINPALREILMAEYERSSSEFVISYGGGGILRIDQAFRRAARRAALSGATPHTIRHTMATALAKEGVPLIEIARFLGHRDSRTTERIYIKYQPDYLKNASDRAAAKTNALVSELADAAVE